MELLNVARLDSFGLEESQIQSCYSISFDDALTYVDNHGLFSTLLKSNCVIRVYNQMMWDESIRKLM